MGELFQAGGFGMYPTAVFGILSIVVGVHYALKPQRRLLPLQVALALVTLLSGALGFVAGLIKSFEALGGVDASRRHIVLIGAGESLHNVALALALVLLAALAVAVGALRLSLPRADEGAS